MSLMLKVLLRDGHSSSLAFPAEEGRPVGEVTARARQAFADFFDVAPGVFFPKHAHRINYPVEITICDRDRLVARYTIGDFVRDTSRHLTTAQPV